MCVIGEGTGHCLMVGNFHLQSRLVESQCRRSFKFALAYIHSCPLTSLAYGIISVYGPDHDADRLHGVETSAIVGPEDTILVFAAVDTTVVPDTV